MIPEGVKVGQSGFAGCTGLTSLMIGEGAKVGESGFTDCTGLTSLMIGEGAQVWERGFVHCTGLTSVVIGEGAHVGKYGFAGCKGLTSLVIGEGAQVGEYGFADCTALKFIITTDSSEIKKHREHWCIGKDVRILGSAELKKMLGITIDEFSQFSAKTQQCVLDFMGQEAFFNFVKQGVPIDKEKLQQHFRECFQTERQFQFGKRFNGVRCTSREMYHLFHGSQFKFTENQEAGTAIGDAGNSNPKQCAVFSLTMFAHSTSTLDKMLRSMQASHDRNGKWQEQTGLVSHNRSPATAA